MNPKKILVVDDDSDFVLAVRMVLEGEGYLVEEAASGAECLAKMRASLPDLVLMDVMMAGPLDGYYTTQEISADPDIRNVPILMISSIASTQYVASFPTDQYLQIVDFISKPIEPAALVDKVRRQLKGAVTARQRIMVIHGDPDMVTALRLPLESAGYEVVDASSNQEGLARIKEMSPALVILDAVLEMATDLPVSLRLRSPDPKSEYAAYKDVPILMLTAPSTAASLRSGPDEVSLPADDFVDKPIDPDVLLEKVRRLIEKREA